MTDEGVKRHKFSVTVDDFIRFLEEKSFESKCPSCGSAAWTVIGSGATEMTYRLITQMRDGPSPTYLNSLGIYCNECGFIRQHIAKVVKRWVDENPEPEQLELDEMTTDESE